jgi:hypothetical protein
MKHSPRYIIFWAVSNYIDEATEDAILNDLSKYKRLTDRLFLKTIKKHFDIEKFNTSPVTWEDIWLYNYLKYDFVKTRFPKKGLIAKYQNEVMIRVNKKIDKLLIFS